MQETWLKTFHCRFVWRSTKCWRPCWKPAAETAFLKTLLSTRRTIIAPLAFHLRVKSILFWKMTGLESFRSGLEDTVVRGRSRCVGWDDSQLLPESKAGPTLRYFGVLFLVCLFLRLQVYSQVCGPDSLAPPGNEQNNELQTRCWSIRSGINNSDLRLFAPDCPIN